MFLSNRLIQITVSVVFFWVVSAELFAEIQPLNADPYDFSAAPQWAKDLRRAEIITLGSVPFVTMGVTLSYSLYRYFAHGMNSAYIPNPFAQSSDAAHLSTSEQIGIICTAAGICVAVGLTDFIWNLIERKIQEKNDMESQNGITVIPSAPQELQSGSAGAEQREQLLTE